MALSSALVWEVRTTGADTSGGGFHAGASGTDYSQQDAPVGSGTDLTTDLVLATVVTSASRTFTGADVGNIIQITAGTGWTVGFYEIVSVAAGAATLDRAPALVGVAGGTWAEGGALASPALPLSGIVAGNTIHVKSGTYSVTSTSANVAGGILNFNTTGSETARIRMIGYQATRGDGGTKPILQSTIGSITLATLNNANSYNSLENFEIDGNAQTSTQGVYLAGRCNYLLRCLVRNCTSRGLYTQNNPSILLCEVTGCSGGNIAAFAVDSGGAAVFGCSVHDNSARGFDLNTTCTLTNCLSYNNTGTSGYGFFAQGVQNNLLVNCTAYGNAQDNFYLQTGNSNLTCVNCLSDTSGGYGFNHNSAPHCLQLINCAGHANTSGNYPNGSNTPQVIENFQALTAAPFTNAAGGDFSLNTTAGGGATCRAAGIPGVFPGGLTTGSLDIGAAQHADPPATASGGTWLYLP